FFSFVVLGMFGVALLTSWVLAQQPAPAGMPQPRLLTIFPMGGKAGTTVEVLFSGQDIEEPEGVLFSHPAIKAEIIAAEPPPQADPKAKGGRGKAAAKPTAAVKYKITIPADAPVGVHDIRLFNKWGVTNPRAFVVGDLAEVNEVEPNNDIAQAQKVELNT